MAETKPEEATASETVKIRHTISMAGPKTNVRPGDVAEHDLASAVRLVQRGMGTPADADGEKAVKAAIAAARKASAVEKATVEKAAK